MTFCRVRFVFIHIVARLFTSQKLGHTVCSVATGVNNEAPQEPTETVALSTEASHDLYSSVSLSDRSSDVRRHAGDDP